METIYEWLLHNVGNEGNYLTILNVRRETDAKDIARFEVMARTKSFHVTNLHIQYVEKASSPAAEPNASTPEKPQENYHFTDENQVIAYLAEGSQAEPAATADSGTIQVMVMEPTGNSGGIAFPSASA